MRRVLITGGRGFLAGPLIARLKDRAEVFAVGLSKSPGVAAFDLTDPSAARAAVRMIRPDEVYHLAGTTRQGTWDAVWRAHVSTTVNLLEALVARATPVRVVISGSSAEYGAAGGGRSPTESADPQPTTLYGAAKLAQTLAALSYARAGLEVVVARIFNVLGPGTPDNLAPGAFARQIARIAGGLQPPEAAVGDLSARRDYVDVRDTAAALEVLMRRGVSGQCYNVGSGRSTPMSDILHGLAATAQVALRTRVDPARLRRSEVRDLAANTGKIRALGWSPKISLEQSLADTLTWWSSR